MTRYAGRFAENEGFMTEEERKELLEACRFLVDDISIEDFIYRVRETELKGWEGPKVKGFSKAVMVLKRAVANSR